MINYFNEVLTGLGISKVKLAKYLGVSRQMLYNYLSLESLEDWPEDKKIKIKTLLGIEEGVELSDITISTKYINEVESRLNEDIKTCKDSEIFNKIRSYNREQQELVIDLFTKLKSGLTINKDDKVVSTLEYLRDFIDLLNIYPELKYTLAYFSKFYKNRDPNEFVYDKEDQFVFESIMYYGLTMYHNKSDSKTRLSSVKLKESHDRFINEINMRNREQIGRTEELNTAKIKALKELGYAEINEKNDKEVLEKIAEIERRPKR